MANQGKRMVQEDELKYLQTLKKEHEDPTAPWGGGSDYTAGEGIDITENVISIDDETVALKTDIPTNYVTTDTAQNITGEKTFVGGKRIKFKQNKYTDKLGFTLYNNSNDEKGYLEYNPTDDGLYLGRFGDYKVTELGFKTGHDVVGSHKLLVPNITIAQNTTDYIPISVNNTKADSSGNISISIPTVPTNVSSFNNDTGYITSSALTGYATESWVASQGYSTFSGSYNDLTNKPTIPTKTSDLQNDSGFITGITSSDVTTALGYTPGTSNFSGDYTDLTNKPDLSIYAQSANLATVATSGSYNDLSNKPSIPTYTTLFSTTPTTGSIAYSISLTDDITKYDEIKVYFNDNDDTIRKFCSIFPEPAIGNKITLTTHLNNSTPRVYIKSSVYLIDTTTSLTIDSTCQQRIGNNEPTTVAYTTNTMLCRPYKIVGIKY